MTVDSNVYAFWDFMAQLSYKTENPYLKSRTVESFERENSKNIYIFGCNDAARQFYRIFAKSYRFAGVFDNAEAKWNTEFEGLKVFNPKDKLPALDEEKDVIVISMRLSADVITSQLDELGFRNYFSLPILIANIRPYDEWVKKSERFLLADLEDIVMLESTNDFDGNCGAIYKFLKDKGSRHRFVLVIKDPNKKRLLIDQNDEVLCPKENYEDLLRLVEIRAKAKWEIWDNMPILKVRDDQTNVFLQHFGMGYKQISQFYRCPEYVDYVLTTNEFVHEMEKDSICYPESATFIYGELPRNDVLYGTEWDELGKLTDKHFDKVVLWAPTLRESTDINRKDSDINYPYGVSLLYEDRDVCILNEHLRKLGVLLIIKPHPRQSLNFSDVDYENIMYLTGERARTIHSYKLLTQIDAMITDYSSIVFDYMLLDRPIAWVLEDRAHYRIDYLMDNPEEYMPGEKIYVLEDLLRFLTDVSKNNDPFGNERRTICNRCNPPFEGKGCETLVEALGL